MLLTSWSQIKMRRVCYVSTELLTLSTFVILNIEILIMCTRIFCIAAALWQVSVSQHSFPPWFPYSWWMCGSVPEGSRASALVNAASLQCQLYGERKLQLVSFLANLIISRLTREVINFFKIGIFQVPQARLCCQNCIFNHYFRAKFSRL